MFHRWGHWSCKVKPPTCEEVWSIRHLIDVRGSNALNVAAHLGRKPFPVLALDRFPPCIRYLQHGLLPPPQTGAGAYPGVGVGTRTGLFAFKGGFAHGAQKSCDGAAGKIKGRSRRLKRVRGGAAPQGRGRPRHRSFLGGPAPLDPRSEIPFTAHQVGSVATCVLVHGWKAAHGKGDSEVLLLDTDRVL